MKYVDFEDIISKARMNRYIQACQGNTRKAMTLYRKNLKLSQELFTVISCFEIALRNKIDQHYHRQIGQDWLRNSAAPRGIFHNNKCRFTAKTINLETNKLGQEYAHSKLVAALGFGFWRYLFSAHQYRAGGQSLLQIFKCRPTSTPAQQYNASFVFQQLKSINNIRNRVAHHEPVCFTSRQSEIDTVYVRKSYHQIGQLFRWMGINESSLLYGLDHIRTVCDEIDRLKAK